MQAKRTAEITRKTNETDIRIKVNLDGKGKAKVNTGIGFFDHMLHTIARHMGIDLEIKAEGDLYIDCHHTVEDVGIVMGMALKKALADKTHMRRFGAAFCPLDEALARSVVDISGRPFLVYGCDVTLGMIGQFPGELWPEFLRGFINHAAINLHLHLLYGENQHHMIEAMAKALALSLKEAITLDFSQTAVPSTKGVIE